jgi:hypothetical protein
MKNLTGQANFLNLLYSVIPTAAITALLWATSANDVSLVEATTAFFLVLIPWHSYRQWRLRHQEELPFFAMIAFMYWLYYALQLFWGNLAVDLGNSFFGRNVDPAKIRDALFMVLLGVASLWLGMRSPLARLVIPRRLPQLTVNPARWNYVRAILILTSAISILEPSMYLLGEGGRQAFSFFLSTVPLLAFTLLFRRFLRKEAIMLDKFLIAAFLISRSVTTLSSGWLGSFASIIILCGVAYAAENRRVPRFALVAVIACILFFQVGKQDFRQTYWTEQTSAGQTERVTFWVSASLEKWGEALSDPSGNTLRGNLSSTLSRVGLLSQTGDVLEQTPSIVPYQNGRLYSYLLYTWVPRAVWPDKPSMSEANQFYQVAYGITAVEDLDKVSIAVGFLTEAYMNFSWLGVVFIMFLVGVFLDLYRRFFFSKSAGLILSSLGIVLLPQMLGIESQMAQYVSGIVQQIVFSLLVLLPAIWWKRSGAPFGSRGIARGDVASPVLLRH